MKDLWRTVLYKISVPLSKLISLIQFPSSVPKLTEKNFEKLLPNLKKGDVILTHTRGHLSNLFIPGEYDHIAWYIGKEKIIEATTKGVVSGDLKKFIMSKHKVLVCRAKFATSEEMAKACDYGKLLIGCEYDFEININNEKWYCSELVFAKTKQVMD